MPEPSDTHEDGRPLPVVRGDVVDERPLAAAAPRVLGRPAATALPAPLLAAAGGFIAGVVTYVAVRVLRAAASPRRVLRLRRKRERGLDIAATRSFLVDVHFLKR